MGEINSESFDWVTARSQCSVGEVFERLKIQVKEDIDKRQQIQKERGESESYFGFRFSQEGQSFVVIVEGDHIHRAVRFERSANSITVNNDEGKLLLEATVTLSNEGQCRLVMNKQEYDLWQFRKMALEDLFFNAYKVRSY